MKLKILNGHKLQKTTCLRVKLSKKFVGNQWKQEQHFLDSTDAIIDEKFQNFDKFFFFSGKQKSQALLLAPLLLSHHFARCLTTWILSNSSLEKIIFWDQLQGSIFVLRHTKIRSVEDKCDCSWGGLYWFYYDLGMK